MSARRLDFDYTSGDRDIASVYAFDWNITVHRVRNADGTFRANVQVSFYGRGSVNGDGEGDTWEDALTQAEANLGDLSAAAYLHYTQRVLVGAENPETMEVAA